MARLKRGRQFDSKINIYSLKGEQGFKMVSQGIKDPK